ncbi:hypothetical protein TRVL_09207 [Trypanosoma vivax]|nr:hypothetical protein TRVL_09207 [Trypanosoma vivax]
MYNGYPQLRVSCCNTPIDVEGNRESVKRGVAVLKPQTVSKVRISFAALTALDNLARGVTCYHTLFADVCGLQLEGVIEVTNVIPPMSNLHDVDDKQAKQDRRTVHQEVNEAEMYKKLQDMLRDEMLDSFKIGCLVISSAYRSAPYSLTVAYQLAQLAIQGHPSVLLVYDPFRTSLMGKTFLRAFVPTAEYIDLYTKSKRRKSAQESELMRTCGVNKAGVLREVPVEVDVDDYQLLSLRNTNILPVPNTCSILFSDKMTQYISGLLQSIQKSEEKLKNLQISESKSSKRDENYVPIAQSVEYMLRLMHLREQAQHLEALCDGILLNSSLLRDL